MKTRLILSALGILCAMGTVMAAEKDARVFEMRTYYASPGKLEDLLARFRNHTLKLFEKHGMTNIGYFVPVDNPENKLIYLLAFPSREAREQSFKNFLADPAWQEARKESEKNGGLVSKMESVFLVTTDYSPAASPSAEGNRVFEMRTYTASPGNLANLNARFRDHTLKLFAKHGMTNVAYFVPMEDQPAADSTLVYFLAHPSVDAAKASFDAFRQDPDWVAARKASEEKAGGSLTVEGGVQSVFLQATDFSPLR